jgi:hypothetical protein
VFFSNPVSELRIVSASTYTDNKELGSEIPELLKKIKMGVKK